MEVWGAIKLSLHTRVSGSESRCPPWPESSPHPCHSLCRWGLTLPRVSGTTSALLHTPLLFTGRAIEQDPQSRDPQQDSQSWVLTDAGSVSIHESHHLWAPESGSLSTLLQTWVVSHFFSEGASNVGVDRQGMGRMNFKEKMGSQERLSREYELVDRIPTMEPQEKEAYGVSTTSWSLSFSLLYREALPDFRKSNPWGHTGSALSWVHQETGAVAPDSQPMSQCSHLDSSPHFLPWKSQQVVLFWLWIKSPINIVIDVTQDAAWWGGRWSSQIWGRCLTPSMLLFSTWAHGPRTLLCFPCSLCHSSFTKCKQY